MNDLPRLLGLLGYAWIGLLCGNAVAAAGCNTPEHGQFDFWVGEWEVRTPAGKVAGINRITREYSGCAVREQYQSSSGYRGESLNVYDSGRRLWRQNWIDNQGGTLLLEGGLREGNMVLEGQTIAVGGKPSRQRISWTPRADGTVTQLWESSLGDDQWSTVFYGIYRRR